MRRRHNFAKDIYDRARHVTRLIRLPRNQLATGVSDNRSRRQSDLNQTCKYCRVYFSRCIFFDDPHGKQVPYSRCDANRSENCKLMSLVKPEPAKCRAVSTGVTFEISIECLLASANKVSRVDVNGFDTKSDLSKLPLTDF